ncbi:MAG: hypothetical protein CSA42_03135 [Gammaproteobacteria bacterium]|nr:MAG: hypothetical protein CSA42_03135 [Gammaproteobacteria bacterium]
MFKQGCLPITIFALKGINFTTTIRMLGATLSIITLTACMGLPDNSNRTISNYLPANPNTTLAKRILPDNHANAGKTGAYLLHEGYEAFVSRLALVENAQQSIDAQYYIWHDDTSGRLLLKSLQKAADRGVRVRLLLDDNATRGMDNILSKLNSHPKIEVRLFNPYAQRKFRSIAYFTDTSRINRRMHNKSFTVDGVISVIGGRNIGDEYFQAGSDLMFADLDVSVVGKVVEEIQQDFDKYWANEASYPIERIAKPDFKVKPSNSSKIDEVGQTGHDIQILNINKTKSYLANLFDTKYPHYVDNNDNSLLVWADKAHFYSDPPTKISAAKDFSYQDSVIAKTVPFIASTKQQLLIISPYFVPTKLGSQFLIDIAKKGKRVIVMTNSLASTDITLVHAGYQKYRKALLAAGVEIYEFKPEPKHDEYGDEEYQQKYRDDYDINGILPDSNASLHAKSFTVDDKYLFVGSPNLDPRSAKLNTELGIVFDSARLAKVVNKAFEQNKDVVNYRLKLNPKGKIEWHTLENGKQVVYYHEPEVDLKDTIIVDILSMLPIDGLL